MHTRSINEEFMNDSDTNEIIKELFKSLFQRYQENLQEKMKGSDFVFDGVNYLYYDSNKISISVTSYIDSPKWLKNKKSTINPKNNDYKCFQYAVTLALNLDKINTNSQRNENWHYLVVKSLSGLLTGITSNHKEDFYCLNCFHSYRTKNKLDAHKKICESHDYCRVEMPTNDNNKIKYNQGEKSIKLPFIVYADLECLLEKINTCYNNPKGSGSEKTNALLNLINNQPDIDKIYLYAKGPYEKKYQYLINKREKVGLNHFNDPKAFMEYSNDMQDVDKNIGDYNPIKKRKILIVFDDMIAV